MELITDTVDFKKIFDNLSPTSFSYLKHRVFSGRMFYVDYNINPLAGKLMNIIGTKEVSKCIDSTYFSWIIDGLFTEETRRRIWLSNICWIIRPVLKNLDPPLDDPHFKGYCNFVCDELIPEFDKQIKQIEDHQKYMDLLIRIYKISACLYYSSLHGRKIDLVVCPAVFVNMDKKIHEIMEQNTSRYNEDEIKYTRFFCVLMSTIIDQEDGI